MRYLVALFALCLLGCWQSKLNVQSIGHPDYPLEARTDGIQGTVLVEIEIGVDGKVIWANGAGAHPALVKAAEQNAGQWQFGPFPRNFKFPIFHQITYVFKLEGHPSFLVTEPPSLRTELPDRVEVSAPPIKVDDRVIVVPNTSPPKKR